MSDALTFDKVSFRYRRSRCDVLADFSWRLPGGRTVLLGPNGAGKSTLLALAAGALRPRSGAVRVGSVTSVGWMPQAIRPVGKLAAREQVAYAAWLQGARRAEAWSSAADALVSVGLGDEMQRPSAELSGGQLRRVGLAEALVGDPGVLLLDEPAVGLDPAQRLTFRRVVAALPGDRPIVISTHQVDDLDELADTVVVLGAGVIAFSGSVAEFMSHGGAAQSARRAEEAYAALLGSGAR